MSELNAGGIRSELVLDLAKWTGPSRQASQDALQIGKSIEDGLAAASKAAGAGMASLGTQLGTVTRAMHDNLAVGMSIGDELRTLRTESNQFGAASLSAFGDLRILLNAVDENLHKLTQHMTQAAAVAKTVQPPPLPPPSGVINWTAGLRSLAGMAGTVNPAMGQMVSGFMAVEGAAAAAGVSLAAAIPPIAAIVATIASAKAALTIGLEGVGLATESARTDILFESFTGSAEAAAKLRGELAALSDQSILSNQEINDSAAKMLSYGISAKDVTIRLAQLSDIAAGVNRPLSGIVAVYGQVLQKGQLYSEEVQQFAEQGIPMLVELAKVYGVSTGEMKKLIDQGVIGFPAVEAAIASMTGATGKFHDINKKLADELPWLMIAKQWENVKREIGQVIIKNLDLASATKGLIEVIKTVGPMIVGAFDMASSIQKGFMSDMSSVVAGTREVYGAWNEVRTLFKEAFGVELPSAIGAITGMVNLLVRPIKVIFDFVGGVANTIGTVVKEMKELLAAVNFLGSDEMTQQMNDNARPTTDAEKAAAAKKAAERMAKAAKAAAGGTGSPAGPGTATTGAATRSSGESDADKAAKEREASLARAKELEFETQIQALRERGLNLQADIEARHHKARAEMAKASTEEERRQIAIARDADVQALIRKKITVDNEQKQREQEKAQAAADAAQTRIADEQADTRSRMLRNASRNEEADRWDVFYRTKGRLAKAVSDQERKAIEANAAAEMEAIRLKYDEIRRREQERAAKSDVGAGVEAARETIAMSRREAFELDRRREALRRLEEREGKHGLTPEEEERKRRLQFETDDETIEARVRARQGDRGAQNRLRERLGEFRGVAGGGRASAAGGGPINVNAPEIDPDKLGKAIASNLIPVIDSRIARAERSARAFAYADTVGRGV